MCFNPRLPGGRRPYSTRPTPSSRRFNPRLPGGRRPTRTTTATSMQRCFNPRLPGGRRQRTVRGVDVSNFVSIHAFRGEGDKSFARTSVRSLVSIHAFRGEGDYREVTLEFYCPRFNPRLPGGRRRRCAPLTLIVQQFQSTPSGGKATSSAGSTR